jgi:hydrogenase-4 component B
MWLCAVGLMVLVAGGIVALVCPRLPRVAAAVGSSTAVAGSALALVTAVLVLVSGREVTWQMPWEMPLGSFTLAVDPLTAVFLLPIAVVVACAAVYGLQYLRAAGSPARIGRSWFFFNLLAASMMLVVTARNGLLFLLCWEGMSLASFFLVLTDHEAAAARRAAWIYVTAMHLGTACLLVLFLLLGRASGSLDFDRFTCESGWAGALFVLAVVGFGTKAGFIPVHVWLPEAHPAAPSHVSAVMSGVMIKTGIYGLLRVATYLGDAPPWWGWTLVTIGVVSGILGVLLALAQHDLKRLLAYHSVENIGIITLGLGVGFLGMAYHRPAMALLGLTGALLHVLNHALFKSLLFLGAGAVQHSTGTRDIDLLGGLFKRMPVTGATFLTGACAISGLPPLNGFLSELLIYLGVLTAIVDRGGLGGGSLVLLCVLVVGGLAIIGGLAAACFTKAFGCVFLGEPRSEHAAAGHEAGALMRAAMVVLAGACVLVALTAPLWPLAYRAAAAGLLPAGFPDVATGLEQAQYVLGFVCAAFWMLLALAALLAWARRRLLAGQQVASGPTWDCGYVAPTARMQYTASSFASPILLLFRMLLRPHVEIHPPPGLFPDQGHFESHTPDVFHDYLFRPMFGGLVWGASKLRWFQNGRLQLYVLYIAVTILVLLVWKLG